MPIKITNNSQKKSTTDNNNSKEEDDKNKNNLHFLFSLKANKLCIYKDYKKKGS